MTEMEHRTSDDMHSIFSACTDIQRFILNGAMSQRMSKDKLKEIRWRALRMVELTERMEKGTSS